MLRPYIFVLSVLVQVFLLLSGPPADADVTKIKLNGGLEASILTLGRDKSFGTVTVALQLSNNGPNILFLYLVPPWPQAVDNTGETLGLIGSAGITKCMAPMVDQCVGNSVANLAFETWTEIDPGTAATVNFVMRTSQPSHGALMSFSASMAYRAVSDLQHDATLTEKDKRQAIHVMTLSFPPTPVTQSE